MGWKELKGWLIIIISAECQVPKQKDETAKPFYNHPRNTF